MIGILAMLMQLLLPAVHAASMAGGGQPALAYAFCGNGNSDGLRAALYAELPAEVRDQLIPDQRNSTNPSVCVLCSAAHGLAAAGPLSLPTLPAFDGPAAAVSFPVIPAALRPLLVLPPSRAPPA